MASRTRFATKISRMFNRHQKIRSGWNYVSGAVSVSRPILVTGGTGTLGQQLVPLLLKKQREFKISRIRILSRSEHRQQEMADMFKGVPVDFLLGDVRDMDRVREAIRGCMGVFHLAAQKSVDHAEYNPEESVKTNVMGTYNVMRAAVDAEVTRGVFTSTDKAVDPFNFYGACKAVAERIWLAGNRGLHQSSFAGCRYGNVLGSNGSLVQKLKRDRDTPITDVNMTRFFMSPKDAAEFVLFVYEVMTGGEIFIPKMKSCYVRDVFEVLCGDTKNVRVIGRRPGEKIHESLVSSNETNLVTDHGTFLIRWPSHNLYPFERWGEGVEMSEGLTSLNAEKFTREELTSLCQSQ